MGVRDLGTLTDAQRTRRAVRKRDLPTTLDRAIAAKAARVADTQRLVAWARAVKDRDRWKDRKTGVTVRRTRSLDPLRAEAHHIASRDDRAVRYDVRNGLCLSLATHDAVERHLLVIVGTRFFHKGGVRYIDGRYKVLFRAG
jgi:hypothetical protein